MASESFALFGRDLFGEAVVPPASGALAREFAVPPFSVLDARQGYWQDRKRAWLSLGIKSEIGRDTSIVNGFKRGFHTSSGGSAMAIQGSWALSKQSGTSIFDPVLCELAYSWFCPAGGSVLDPFAGGSVRGVVASMLGRPYVGVELRAEQIDANREQAAALCNGSLPLWVQGDSRDICQLAPARADFVFSCPPYADLEVYSDDPRDLSTLDYPEFVAAYRDIIAGSVALLKEDRFACFVVGDVRAPDGAYRGLVADTTRAFEAAGARFYNDCVLVTPAGTLPLRTQRMFRASRKVGKSHQNVLVFVKGNPKRAAAACGALKVDGV